MKRTFLAVLMGVSVGLFAACGVEAPVEESPPVPAQQSAAVCSGCGDGVCTWCDGDMCPEECGVCGDSFCSANESAFGSCPQDCTPTKSLDKVHADKAYDHRFIRRACGCTISSRASRVGAATPASAWGKA